MTAEQLYTELDRAGLTPPVHYAAAPHEWRECLERIDGQLAEAKRSLVRERGLLERHIKELSDDLDDAESDNRKLLKKLNELQEHTAQ